MGYDKTIAEGVYNELMNDPKTIPLYNKFCDMIIEDNFIIDKNMETEISYKDLFLQEDGRGSYSGNFQKGAVIMDIHEKIVNSEIKVKAIKAGKKPFADKKEEENSKVIKNLPNGFSSQMFFSNNLGDGILKDPEGNNYILEVGTTKPYTLFWHMHTNGNFARWPYNSDYIYLFKMEG